MLTINFPAVGYAADNQFLCLWRNLVQNAIISAPPRPDPLPGTMQNFAFKRIGRQKLQVFLKLSAYRRVEFSNLSLSSRGELKPPNHERRLDPKPG